MPMPMLCVGPDRTNSSLSLAAKQETRQQTGKKTRQQQQQKHYLLSRPATPGRAQVSQGLPNTPQALPQRCHSVSQHRRGRRPRAGKSISRAWFVQQHPRVHDNPLLPRLFIFNLETRKKGRHGATAGRRDPGRKTCSVVQGVARSRRHFRETRRRGTPKALFCCRPYRKAHRRAPQRVVVRRAGLPFWFRKENELPDSDAQQMS